MKNSSFENELNYSSERVQTKLILESSFTKEIGIAMKQGQKMKEHKTPYPIVVHLLKGEVDFSCEGKAVHLKEGDILTLEGSIPHDLRARTDSKLRLSLCKIDQLKRVQQVVDQK